MGMPTIADLQSMYGDWNPQAYLEAQRNAGLERQFREQQYAQEREKARQESLKTLWDQEDRPRKILEKELTNRNLDYTGRGLEADARTRAVAADVAESGKKFQINEQQRKELLAIPAHAIALREAQANDMAGSLDPVIRKHGEELRSFTKFYRDEKEKHARDIEKVNIKEAGDTKRTGMINATQLKVAQMNQEGQDKRAAAKGANAVSWARSLDKLSPDKQIASIQQVLTTGIDPDTQQPLSDLARMGLEARYRQVAAVLDAKPPPVSEAPVLDPNTKQLVTPTPRPSVDTRKDRKAAGTKDDPIILK